MNIFVEIGQKKYSIDPSAGLDISMPLHPGTDTANCFFAPYVEFNPVRMGDFVGSIREGGIVNFFNIKVNPHGNGTHTECVGHITKEVYTINQCLKEFLHLAQLVSIYPTKLDNGDRVIMKHQVEELYERLEGETPRAFVIRTLPNDALKLRVHYSGTNPPYLHHEAAAFLAEQGVEHLLLDLPSVDREEDGAMFLAHKAFWQYPGSPRTHCTITELIYAAPSIPDGHYLLTHQIASFELDASPSKPMLYSFNK